MKANRTAADAPANKTRASSLAWALAAGLGLFAMTAPSPTSVFDHVSPIAWRDLQRVERVAKWQAAFDARWFAHHVVEAFAASIASHRSAKTTLRARADLRPILGTSESRVREGAERSMVETLGKTARSWLAQGSL